MIPDEADINDANTVFDLNDKSLFVAAELKTAPLLLRMLAERYCVFISAGSSQVAFLTS
jgi:hypothetical protein